MLFLINTSPGKKVSAFFSGSGTPKVPGVKLEGLIPLPYFKSHLTSTWSDFLTQAIL